MSRASPERRFGSMNETVIPVFFDSSSSAATPYREVLRGIRTAAQKSGMRIVTVSEHALADYRFENAARAALIASDSLPYVRRVIALLRAEGRRIVLAGLDAEQFGTDISCATPSRRSETQQMVNYLYAIGCTGFALVGFGVHSINDTFRCHAAMSAVAALGLTVDERDVWRWQNDPEAALSSFLASAHRYRAAICPNDNMAVQLIRLCKRQGIRVPEDLYVCSFGDKVIGRYYTPSVTTMTMDYYAVGESSFYAWQMLSRQPEGRVCALKLTVPGRLLVRQSTDCRLPAPVSEMPAVQAGNDPFYSVPFVQPLAELENCLSACDELDLRLIARLLDGRSYEVIADQLYISESTLKYRLNKLYAAVHAKGKKEFVRFVRSQLESANPFEEYLK